MDKKTQLINVIVEMIHTRIVEADAPVPSFSWSYWMGYCHALESERDYRHNELWLPVKEKAIRLCDLIRAKSTDPLTHAIS